MHDCSKSECPDQEAAEVERESSPPFKPVGEVAGHASPPGGQRVARVVLDRRGSEPSDDGSMFHVEDVEHREKHHLSTAEESSSQLRSLPRDAKQGIGEKERRVIEWSIVHLHKKCLPAVYASMPTCERSEDTYSTLSSSGETEYRKSLSSEENL